MRTAEIVKMRPRHQRRKIDWSGSNVEGCSIIDGLSAKTRRVWLPGRARHRLLLIDATPQFYWNSTTLVSALEYSACGYQFQPDFATCEASIEQMLSTNLGYNHVKSQRIETP